MANVEQSLHFRLEDGNSTELFLASLDTTGLTTGQIETKITDYGTLIQGMNAIQYHDETDIENAYNSFYPLIPFGPLIFSLILAYLKECADKGVKPVIITITEP